MTTLIKLCLAWLAASLVAGPLAGRFLATGLGRDEEPPPEWWEPWMAEGEEQNEGSEPK